MSSTFIEQFISKQSDVEFLKANMMGPNAMRISDKLATHLKMEEDMRILYLGCGTGLSTFL